MHLRACADLFTGDAAAIGAVRHALYEENRFATKMFTSGTNFFARSNVTVIVLEIPNARVGNERVRAWATISPSGTSPEIPVFRRRSPSLTYLCMSDHAAKKHPNRSTRAGAQTQFAQQLTTVIEKIIDLDGSLADPGSQANRVVGLLFPAVLSFDLGSRPAFTGSGVNGPALGDDAAPAPGNGPIRIFRISERRTVRQSRGALLRRDRRRTRHRNAVDHASSHAPGCSDRSRNAERRRR